MTSHFLKFKERYIAGAVGVVGGFLALFLLFLSGSAIPQTVSAAVNNGGCRVATGQTPSGTSESVYALTIDGYIPAVTGSYNLNISCDSGTAAGACSAAGTAANTAMGQGNDITGFPQGDTNGSSGNNITIEIGDQGAVCGTRPDGTIPGACEKTASVEGGGTNATIYINAASVQGATLLGDPDSLLSVVEHEMSHAFGADDTYTYIPQPDDNGLMSNGINTGGRWATDPLLQGLIKSINTGATLDCLSPCPTGFVSAITTSNPNPYPACKLPPPPPLPPPPTVCTNAQLAEGWTDNPTVGCIPPQGVVPTSCSCIGSTMSCMYSNGMTSSDPNNSACTGTPNCGSGTWNPSTNVCACSAGYTWNPTTMGCEAAPSAPTTNCTCQGNNLVCALADGSTVSNYNPTCASQAPSSTSPSDCNPDDPVASPDCPANPSSPTSTNPTQPAPVNCSTDPNNPSCTTNYCAQNPTDPDCEAYCSQNPTDSACSGDNPENDPAYCQNNPSSPSCVSDTTGGDGGSGGQSGGTGGGCVFDDSGSGPTSYINANASMLADISMECD